MKRSEMADLAKTALKHLGNARAHQVDALLALKAVASTMREGAMGTQLRELEMANQRMLSAIQYAHELTGELEKPQEPEGGKKEEPPLTFVDIEVWENERWVTHTSCTEETRARTYVSEIIAAGEVKPEDLRVVIPAVYIR